MEEFGNIEVKGMKLWSDLRVLETVEEIRVLAVGEKLDKERISRELEDICWRQKSRVFCIKGDRNTKLFRCMANSTLRRFNSIDMLMVDGRVMSSNQGSIAECITHFY